MPYNGSGTFVRERSWQTDRSNNEKIKATLHDQEDDGFAVGLSNCMTRDGQAPALADQDFGSKRLKAVGAATVGTDAMNRDGSDARYILAAGDSRPISTTSTVYGANFALSGTGISFTNSAATQNITKSGGGFDIVLSGNSAIRLATSGAYRWGILGGGDFVPLVDAFLNIGGAANRANGVYAVNGTINTSDAREKTAVRPLTASEIAAAQDMAREIGIYQFLSAVAVKGPDKARLHVGMTVQHAIDIMAAHGLDASPFSSRYAFICFDTWDAIEAVAAQDEVPAEYPGDPNARPAVEAVIGRPAGNRYGFRYDQLWGFILRGLVAEQDNIKTRLAVLEAARAA